MTAPRPRPTKAKPRGKALPTPRTVYLYIETLPDGSHRAALGVENDDRSGYGYRICGPKYDGSSTKGERKYPIGVHHVGEIRAYLRMVAPAPSRRSSR